jgi:methyl-accepting chemotaxis protein
MNANTLGITFGAMGLLFSCISMAYLFFTRGQASGRVIQAIQQSADNEKEMNRLLQAQALALQKFGEGMGVQGEAMKEIAESFRDFAHTQQDTNKEFWRAIQTSSTRVNDLISNCRECKYAASSAGSPA